MEAVDAMTRADQFQSWFVIPLGVFLVLLVALRNPLTCLNLVATMLLTYAFAAEVLERIAHAPLRALGRAALLERLPDGARLEELL